MDKRQYSQSDRDAVETCVLVMLLVPALLFLALLVIY